MRGRNQMTIIIVSVLTSCETGLWTVAAQSIKGQP
jgi:hypothetical protein